MHSSIITLLVSPTHLFRLLSHMILLFFRFQPQWLSLKFLIKTQGFCLCPCWLSAWKALHPASLSHTSHLQIPVTSSQKSRLSGLLWILCDNTLSKDWVLFLLNMQFLLGTCLCMIRLRCVPLLDCRQGLCSSLCDQVFGIIPRMQSVFWK